LTTWHMAYGFRIFGNVAASILYGKFDATGIARQFQNNVPNVLTADIKDNDHWKTVPHLQIILGFEWGSCLWDDKMFFSLKAGWEVNEFRNLHPFPFPAGIANTVFSVARDLAMQGLTIETRLDF